MATGVGYLSAAGVNFLLNVEGWSGGKDYKNGVVCKQYAIDRSGVITVGPGMTNIAYPNIVQAGKTVTFTEICWMFNDFIAKMGAKIDAQCPQIKNFGQECVDMVISIAYNAGGSWIGKFKNCQSANDVYNIIIHGPQTANGKILSGLQARRMAEANITKKNNVNSKSAFYFSGLDQRTQDVIACCGGNCNGYVPVAALTNNFASIDNSTVNMQYASNTGLSSSGANSVYMLSSATRANENVLKQAEDRRQEFDALRNSMTANSPQMGRDIIMSSTLYDSNILKGNQESKKNNNQTKKKAAAAKTDADTKNTENA